VQRNIVDMQLQMMFQIVRVWISPPLPEGSRVSIADMGIASPKAFWAIAYKSSRTNMTTSLSRKEGVKNSERCAPFIGETLFSFIIPFMAWRLSEPRSHRHSLSQPANQAFRTGSDCIRIVIKEFNISYRRKYEFGMRQFSSWQDGAINSLRAE
jgi:hypothetical protein